MLEKETISCSKKRHRPGRRLGTLPEDEPFFHVICNNITHPEAQQRIKSLARFYESDTAASDKIVSRVYLERNRPYSTIFEKAFTARSGVG
jgi:hypothetical protein